MTTLTDAWLAEVLTHPGYRLVAPVTMEAQAATTRPPAASIQDATDRYKSQTERRYAALLEHWKQEGQILGWWYEPCKGLYLAPKQSYTPDFLVQYPARDLRLLEFHEVKGGLIRAKDRQKLKQAAALFPCFRFVLCQWQQAAWSFQEVPAR
jgi:hypothetical protein